MREEDRITVMLILRLTSHGESCWELGGLNDNRMVRVGWESQGAAGSEGGTADSLERNHVDPVGSGLEVDQVEGASQGQGGRTRAVDLERRNLLLLLQLTTSSLPSRLELEPEGGTACPSRGLGNHRALHHHLVHGGDGLVRDLLLLQQLLNTGPLSLLHGDFLLSSSSSSSLLTIRPGHFTSRRLGFLCGSHTFSSLPIIQNTGYGGGTLEIIKIKN